MVLPELTTVQVDMIPVHAALVGTAMLASAAWLADRPNATQEDHIKAVIIVLGFAGLWIWEASTQRLGLAMLVAPLLPAAAICLAIACRARA